MANSLLDFQQDLADIRRLIREGLNGYSAKIYLFGSWARGNPSPTSDVDVAVLCETPLPPWVLSQIRHTLEDSNILPQVDLLDLATTDLDFQHAVLQYAIPWND